MQPSRAINFLLDMEHQGKVIQLLEHIKVIFEPLCSISTNWMLLWYFKDLPSNAMLSRFPNQKKRLNATHAAWIRYMEESQDQQ